MSSRKIQLLKDDAPRPELEVSSPKLKYEPGASASELWRKVLAHYDDDDLHRAFIRACFNEKQLRFALDSYRTLEKLRPGDAAAIRYLAQVGKAMELGAMGNTSELLLDKSHERLFARPMRVVMLLSVGLAAIMVVYAIASALRGH